MINAQKFCEADYNICISNKAYKFSIKMCIYNLGESHIKYNKMTDIVSYQELTESTFMSEESVLNTLKVTISFKLFLNQG